jgi:hypothetical protein
MLFAPETSIFAQLSNLFMSQFSIREPRVKSNWVKFPPTSAIKFIYLFQPFVGTKRLHTRLFVKSNLSEVCSVVLILFFEKPSEGTYGVSLEFHPRECGNQHTPNEGEKKSSRKSQGSRNVSIF